MHTPEKRTSRFAVENSLNGGDRKDSLISKYDTGKQHQLSNGVHGRSNASSASSLSSRPQWPRTYQNAMNSRLVGGPDVTDLFRKLVEFFSWSYAYLLQRKRPAWLPGCLP
ncbi:hypothetical protein R1sor_010708 [Riccia sorocarpa]|uniref:Uncharacterized protein n=1 Tax=Riccia sorocarpa TaxID=122646 RepID=A0ABD3HYT9_9MARC